MHKSRNLSEKKRRDQFNVLINELCAMVTSSNRKMDKSTVLRSTISFLKSHNELAAQSKNVVVQDNWKPSFFSSEEFTHLMLEALDGFILVFSRSGNILYTSESAASLLGYLPGHIGSSIFDVVHESDKASLYKLISNAPSSANNFSTKDSFISLLLHMKCGPIHSQNCSDYELVRLVGTFYHWPSAFEGSESNYECDSNSSVLSPMSSSVEWRSCFVAVGQLQIPHLLRVANLSEDTKNEFTSRHSLEWKFLYLDHRAPPIIGYLPFEVLGTSGYDYYHMDDLDKIATCHELLKQTGEGTSCVYRFLTKGQQWIWLRTRYYISYHQWNSKPEFVVCTHTVVSTEKVLKDIPEATKYYEQLSQKCQSPIPANTSALSAYFCPSPSVSSLGSISSDHSEKCKYEVHSKMRRRPICKSLSNETPVSIASMHTRHQPSISSVQQQHSPAIKTSMTISPIEAVAAQSPSLNQPENLIHANTAPGPSHQTNFSSLSMPTNILGPQQPEENLPPIENSAQMHDYLYQRHQMLQQQILMQQEELRRVSEQLRLVQFASPALPQTPTSMQFQAMACGSAPSFINSYSVTSPRDPMAAVNESAHPTQSFVTSTSYMNIEADFQNISSEELSSQVSQQQSGEIEGPNFKDSHYMLNNP